MFSLIITIISIALVAALALATLYYGGDSFNKGTAGAEASRLINEGQQVNGAVTLAKADGVTVGTLNAVVTAKYLSQLPGSFSAAGATVVGTVAGQVSVASTLPICQEVQKRAGAIETNGIYVMPVDLAAAKAETKVFGCFGVAGAAAPTFFYKF